MQDALQDLKGKYWQATQELPWHTHQISLLLDGINVPNILPLIYANPTIKQFDLLYIQTPFTELKDVSPCLIKLDTPTSYPIEIFLDNINNEWGYLLASQAPWQEQVNHLRKLLVIKTPHSDQEVMLKIADPLVAEALLTHAEQQNNSQLFGPFTYIITANILTNSIHHLIRPNAEITELTSPYKLTDKENLALDKVDINRDRQILYHHMDTHFPAFLAHYPQTQRKQAIDYILDEATALNYKSLMTQAYYLNIYGYLGDNALEDYPHIAEQVKKQDTDLLKEAAVQAEYLAQQINKGIA